jgi:hypothetical protein
MQVITLVCDVCPPTQKAKKTVTFALDGKAYEEELCSRHLKKFSRLIEHYASHARKVRASARPRRTRRSRQHSAEVRSWAIANGHKVPPRGRIPEAITAEYDRAHIS